MQNIPLHAGPSRVRILHGQAAILPLGPLLEELAGRCGQAGEMGGLAFSLNAPLNRRKSPVLILFATYDQATGDERVVAAVLLFEYRLWGMRTGAFAAYDRQGFNAVIAPPADCAAVALAAADALLHDGAHILLLPCAGFSVRPADIAHTLADFDLRWTQQHRVESRSLRLGASLEATLSRFGRKTRFNMGYYRRRLLRRMGCELLPDVRSLLSGTELDRLNAGSLNPVPSEEFKLRYKVVCDLPGGFVMGLRADDGRWLSLIGGWRQGATVVLHWQLNTAGFEKDSIGTVMRSYFMEHEIGRGMRLLTIEGGTMHSMRHAFTQESIAELVVRRRSLRSLGIRMLAHAVASPHGFRSRINPLARILQNRSVVWHAASYGQSTPQRLAKPALQHPQVSPVPPGDAEFRSPAA